MQDTRKRPSNPSPRLEANFVSRLSFWWLWDLFWYGKSHNLRPSDLYDVLPENVSEPLGDALEVSWDKEVTGARKKGREPSLWRAIARTFGWSIVKYGVGVLLLNGTKILQPLILGMLIWYFDPLSTMDTREAYAWATGLVLVTMLQTIIIRQAHLGQTIIGMRVRVACSSLIYRKVLRLSSASANKAAGGLIINLLSNDMSKFEIFSLHLHYMWIMPLVVVLITYLIWQQLGIAAIAGVLFMIVQIMPTQVCWYKMTSKMQAKGAVRTDKRVLLIGEIINGILVIKMYVWEKYFEQLVYLARRHEIDAMLKRFYVRSVRIAFTVFSHRTALFCAILVYVLRGNAIAADRIFSTVQYFMLLRMSLAQFFTEAISLGAEVNVSIKRIEKFLLLDEIEQCTKPLGLSNDVNVVSIKDVKASWEKNSHVNNLCDINVFIPAKKLYAIVGSVGSGKSSILKLILGELTPHSGEIQVHGSVSYASQEPWLFTGSVRDNILFGKLYDAERYERVTRACALLKDFEQMPYGDKTLVGERGMALSGGQCARVSLARAVYRNAEIYLFDDPLSAVDAHVGKTIFEDCINGLLKEKTRILVTHHVQYLKQVDSVILLTDGQVEYQGTFENFYKTEKFLRYLPLNDEMEKVPVEVSNTNVAVKLLEPTTKVVNDDDKGPEETDELISKGRVAKLLYLKYIRAGGSYFTLSILLLSFVLTQLSISGFDWWLSFWTKQEEKRLRLATNITNVNASRSMEHLTNLANNMNTTYTLSFLKVINFEIYLDRDTALSVYAGLILSTIIFSNIRNLLFYRTFLNSSRNIHNNMFARLVRAPIKFFNSNPSGRIVNRFSKDTGAVDEALPHAILYFVERCLFTIGILVQILIINWWTVFPMIVMVYLFMRINDIYLSTVQDIKRLEGNAKSPVFSLVNSSMLGLLTIRSCRAQKIVSSEFDARQDNHTAAHYLTLVTSSAFGFWLDMTLISFLAFLCYNFIFIDDSDTFAGDVGLALTQILTITGMLQFAMKQCAEIVAQMTSVERMFQYTNLKQEGPFETLPTQMPEKSWPSQGEIKFRDLYLRYGDEEEPVLKNLNFTVTPNMKVGIVGRTGAGKSSLISALFRLGKTDGSLLIDNIDTKNIGLFELRNKISIIPQEPVLFSASLRNNLDPFHNYDDAQLWSALEEVELTKVFESLDHPVNRGGSNLSSGQRQLLCLARAIVKKNKILILDEATANVDPTTDDLIQKTIRTKFGGCTVLTIAHRLNTIMDSDKVLVMDNGEVVEFDHPYVLLQRNDSYFSRMVQQSGNAMSQHLRAMAEKAFKENLERNALRAIR